MEKDLHASEQDSKTPTLNTSIDFLLSGKHTSTNLPDLDKEDVSYEKKRKKKKKKKRRMKRTSGRKRLVIATTKMRLMIFLDFETCS